MKIRGAPGGFQQFISFNASGPYPCQGMWPMGLPCASGIELSRVLGGADGSHGSAVAEMLPVAYPLLTLTTGLASGQGLNPCFDWRATQNKDTNLYVIDIAT